MKVCIDPGHGGSNAGASRSWFGNESDFVLNFGKRLRDAINATGIDAIITRTDDYDMRWDERREISEDCDLVLPIHVDTYPDPRTHGLLAFHWARNPVGYEIASTIAANAPKGLVKSFSRSVVAIGSHTRGWDRAAYVVGAYPQTTVLIELGKISNLKDAELLQRTEIQVGLIGAILCGVARMK